MVGCRPAARVRPGLPREGALREHAPADDSDGPIADEIAPPVVSVGPDIRPALGDPAEVAKTLVAEAKAGVDVVRLVAGDPLSVDAVITEVNAVARTHLSFEIVPGLPATSAVPTYAGLPLGSTHTVADVRGEVDWAALAAAPGPLILHATASHLADAARTLIEYGLADEHPVRGHRATAPPARSVRWSPRWPGLTDRATLAGGSDPAGPLAGTAGGHHRQDRRPPRQAELVGEPRPVRLDRAGAAHQGSGRRDERPAGRPRRAADRGADHRRRAAAQPGPDGTGRQGSGRRPLPVGGVHLHQRGARGVGEVRRVRSGRPRVLRCEDRLRRRVDRRPGARLRDQPRAGALRRAVLAGPARRIPGVRRAFSTRSTGCCCRAPTSPPRRWPRVCASAAGRSRTSPPTAPCAPHRRRPRPAR